MHNPIIVGNSKMGRRVVIFNLPPVKTCKPSAWCLHGRDGKPACYALRNNFCLPNVIRSAEARLVFSRSAGFVEEMVVAITKARIEYFRFHSSGDFYSAEYIRKVEAVARACPDVKFRTTTRRRDFRAALARLNRLPNFIVRESLDDEHPRPTMGLPFAALGHMAVAASPRVIVCSNDCVACGYSCWESRASMCFEEH